MMRATFNKDLALRMAKEGYAYALIAEHFGMSENAIGLRLNRLGFRRIQPHQLSAEGRVTIQGDTAVFRLPCGEDCLLDVEDVSILAGFTWKARTRVGHSRGYVCRQSWKRRTVFLHRELLKAPPKALVDHINGNTLDNRKRNLRFATYAGNSQNRGLSIQNKSGFKGVSRFRDKWQASIRAQGKSYSLGHFDSALEAALAYDKACREMHGEYARPNFAVEHLRDQCTRVLAEEANLRLEAED